MRVSRNKIKYMWKGEDAVKALEKQVRKRGQAGWVETSVRGAFVRAARVKRKV